jgi:amylosucrase
VLSIGGIPLIYLGDEIGIAERLQLCRTTRPRRHDSRWVHRPRIDWAQMARRSDPATLEGRIFGGMQHLIQLRKATPAFAGNDMRVLNLGNDHVFAFVRTGRQGERVLVLANFSEHTQPVAANEVRLYGLGYRFHEVITQQEMTLSDAPIVLEPYQVMWLAA